MRLLVIHQNFPGQFRRLIEAWSRQTDWQIVGIGREEAPGMNSIRWLKYRLHRKPAEDQHRYLRLMENAVLHGQAVARILLQLKRSGFSPDVVLAHPGWGETLYVKDVFPDARLIHFCEWYYGTPDGDMGFDLEFPITLDDRTRVGTWNALHLLNLQNCDAGVTPTLWQHSRHPEVYRSKIAVIHEGIDTDALRPDANACLQLPDGSRVKHGDPVVTYVARNLEPYRGFHQFMRALEIVQREHPTCRALIVGGDEVSYGASPKDAPNWRTKLLKEVKLDPSRTHFLGRVPYDVYRQVLQVSAAHVYLTYPFVLSWSMLEAMAAGCLVIGSNTAPVREVIQDGEDGVLVDFSNAEQIAKAILKPLGKIPDYKIQRQNARKLIFNTYSLEAGIFGYNQFIKKSLHDSKSTLDPSAPRATRTLTNVG